MAYDRATVQEILDKALADGRSSLSAPEAKLVADAYGIPTPGEALATSADEAAASSSEIGFPVVLKIVSPDILHKTDAGGVVVGVDSEDAAREAYDQILANAKAYQADADITGVQVQKMLVTGADVQEVIVGAVTDPAFGKIVAFGLGGVLVEVLKDITFRLAPATDDEAMSMVEGIGAAEILNGVRGAKAVDKESLAGIIKGLSDLVSDFPQFSEVDLNPVLAGPDGATAVDVRIILDPEGGQRPEQFTQEEILVSMNRIMKPKAIAVIGASNEDGKIGNSVMKNLINGGYRGSIFPINPKSDTVLDLPAYKSITDVPEDVDVAVFAVPAKFVAGALEQCGEKGVAGAILIPSGFAETGEQELQDEVVAVARKHGVRVLGPNIYGYYYTPENLCATFCTPYDVKGSVALSSQSGGIGMAILGFSRSSKMGVSSIVGVGNKADIDEDDLLTFFESDENTQLIAMHLEDLKDGRSFAEVASRVVQEEAGRRAQGRTHRHGCPGGELAHGRTGRQRQGVRRHPQAVRCDPGAGPGPPARVRPGRPEAAHAEGRERPDHHRRRWLGSAALRRGRRQRPEPDGDAGGPRREVRRVHPAVRGVRQPGRHHRWRAAVDVPEHDRAGPRGRPDPLVDPRLLAHDRDAADGLRQARRRGGGGVPCQGHREARGRLAVR